MYQYLKNLIQKHKNPYTICVKLDFIVYFVVFLVLVVFAQCFV